MTLLPQLPTPEQQAEIESLQRALANYEDALQTALAVSAERDDNFFPKGLSEAYADRGSWDRKKVFAEALRAWRVNPLIRRMVRLSRSFILGKGITLKSAHKGTEKFLTSWWKDPLNRLPQSAPRMVDELIRTGNLFLLYTVHENGMTHVRAIPAERIHEIESAENDIEQELYYWQDETGSVKWEAYNPAKEQAEFVLHFAINKPVGAQWGESDITPILTWAARFTTWLEDRVRLNHFRTVFMYIVQGNFKSEQEKKARSIALNANPPKAGSILVTDPSEQWGIMSASLDSFDASVDGLAIKRMIVSGVGHPMHWYAEPEGSTRTTAEAAGTPTFRTLEEQQQEVFEIFQFAAQVAATIRANKDRRVKADAEIWVEGPDITERDNAVLALALGRAYPNLADLYDRGAIDGKEFLRLTYKMLAEVSSADTPEIEKKPINATPAQTQDNGIGGQDSADPATEGGS